MYFGIEGSFGSKGDGFQSSVGTWVGAGGGLGPRYGFCGIFDDPAVLRFGAGFDPWLGEGFDPAAAGDTASEGSGAAGCETEGDGEAVAASGLAVGVPALSAAGGVGPPAAPEQPPSNSPPISTAVTAPAALPLELTPTTRRSRSVLA
ncbi:hypothetical protein [Streptomyces sp. NPDC056491]|uniref:hypothetical protein n=1 Tax=Streptomyces sp. NPDC056491 TaxID=3345837 RepID=UPI0036AB628B